MRKNHLRNFRLPWAFLFMMVVTGGSVQAAVHPIPSTPSDSLEHFIENITYWNPGDTIMLSEATTYTVSGTIDLFQEITVMGDPGLDEKPTLLLVDNGFRPKEDTINITIKGFKAIGWEPTDSSSRAGYLLRFDQAAFKNYKNIVVEDIEAWGFQGGIQLYKSKGSIYDTVIVNNVVFHDMTNQLAIDLGQNLIGYLSVTNSTFYNIQKGILGEFWAVDQADANYVRYDKEVIIEHNTFYNVIDGGTMFAIHNIPDSTLDLTFQNNIASTLFNDANARPFRADTFAGPFVIQNSTLHQFNTNRAGMFNYDTIAYLPNATDAEIDILDPGFADAAAGDFTLPDYSPLLTAGTDGKMIGDPRWVPTGTLHRIPNTSADTLEHFIENTIFWRPGDTIMLVDASQYIVTGTTDIFQDVTIMGDPELAEMPEIRFDDNGFRPKVEHVSVEISNLKLNGYNADNTHRAPFILRYQLGTGAVFKNITIKDCNAWGFGGGIDLNQGKHAFYDSILVDNVVWHDFLGEYCIDPNINFAKYVKVTNSTFHDIGTGFIKNPSYSHPDNNDTIVPKRFIIDQNTFYKVAGNNNSLIQVNDPKDQTVTLTFTNNIVVDLYQPDNARPFRIDPLAGEFTIRNSVFNNYDVTEVTKMQYNLDTVMLQDNVHVSAIYEDYPEFADSAARDFTLPDESPLLEAGVTGIAIGDPRWWPEDYNPGANVHRIPSIPADSLEHFIEDISNWKPRDIIMLVDDATYTVSGTIDIFQEVTIMGDPTLANKPVILMVDNGFRAKEDTISITLKGFNAIGWEPTDSSSRAGFLLRFDQAAFKNYKSIVVEDIEAWGFQGGIQLYKNKGSIYDTLVVNNVIFHDMSNQLAIDLGQNLISYVSVTNSTFYTIQKGILGEYWAVDQTDPNYVRYDKKAVIEHNTFYNVIDGGTMFAVHNIPDSTLDLTFQNNIASTLYNYANARPFRADTNAGPFTIRNSTLHQFNSNRAGMFNYDTIAYLPNATVVAIDTNDPNFADAESGYFMLSDDSPLLMAGTDGGAVGDPRWVPQIGISIRPVTGRILTGDEVQLIADVVLSEGSDKTVTWTVENNYGGTTGSATIDAASGLLTAVGGGQVKVTATSNHVVTLFDTVIVTIDELVLVNSITLISYKAGGASSTSITAKGDSLDIRATVAPENADNKTLQWSISGDGDATIKELNENTIRIIAVTDGDITVAAAAQDGSGVSGTVDISISGQAVGLNDKVVQEIGIAPNPAKSTVRISAPERSEVIIHDILGNVMITRWVDVDGEINLQHLEAGLYFIIVRSGDYSRTVRLVKE